MAQKREMKYQEKQYIDLVAKHHAQEEAYMRLETKYQELEVKYQDEKEAHNRLKNKSAKMEHALGIVRAIEKNVVDFMGLLDDV
jgi:alpha-galactosidase/6-phospho-beta-glucosidase family protein